MVNVFVEHGAQRPPGVSLVASIGSSDANNVFEEFVRTSCRVGQSRVAIVGGRKEWTYANTIEKASQFSRDLLSSGTRKSDRIAVILGNSSEFVAAALGIWKCGAVLVPLNPQLTEAEVLRYVVDCSVRTVATATRYFPLFLGLQARGAPIERIWVHSQIDDRWTCVGPTQCRRSEQGSSDAPLGSGQPAIIQYSTGATGYPKRVTRTHQNLLGEFNAVSSLLGVLPGDRILGVAPFFHSHGLMNGAMLALLSGAKLYIQDGFFPRDTARLIEREQISVFPGVPFMFQLVAELREARNPSTLRIVLSAGAPLPKDTASAFQSAYGVEIRQLYGSTETGVISIGGSQSTGADSNSVGHAIPGVTLEIVDQNDNIVSNGTSGRVRIASPYAALRYDNVTSLDESHFSNGYFFPGDVGRTTDSGELVLCGRDRKFINVGGNKVDPVEVETILLTCHRVAEAAVFGIPDGPAGEKVKAVVVPTGQLSREEVRAHCLQHLAEFKHPRIIEFRSALPKSALGKILRKNLMEDTSSAPLGDEVSAPHNRHIPFVGVSSEDTPRLARAPQFLRVLLATDGTVTKSIEAYFLESIEVVLLGHVFVEVEQGSAELDVSPGDSVLRRHVLLRGADTRLVYAIAESSIAYQLLPAETRRKLVDERQGIGELVRDTRMETYREILSISSANAGRWAASLEVGEDALVFSRRYKIFHEKRAIVYIQEVFPECRFQSL